MTPECDTKTNETLVKKIPLANGQTLHILDASRKVAGDRWQVTLLARMRIPVENPGIRTALGEAVTFEVKKQRHFIDEQERQAVFDALLSAFETISLPYLSRPDFPRRYVEKEFRNDKLRMRNYELMS